MHSELGATLHRFRWGIAVMAMLGSAAPLVGAAHAGGTACTDASRACMIAAANTYLDALLSHDASRIRLAPNARRTENGMDTGDGAAAIRTSLTPPTPDEVNTGMRDKRWFVDADEAIAFYLLDTSTLPPSPLHTSTTHLVERFRVDRGLIREIEAIFWVSPGPSQEGSGWPKPRGEAASPPAPALSPPQTAGSSAGWCRDASPRCEISAADTYIKAIVGRDYRQTRLADDVRRTQNAGTTATDAQGVRRNGQDPHPDAFITRMRDERWFVDGNQAICFSVADVGTYPRTGIHTATVHLTHRIKVVTGRIEEIESVYWIAPGTSPEPSGWERH
ncbi:MAG: hypothetical protein ACYDH6_15810 [Acidimicrobiales bacterium]